MGALGRSSERKIDSDIELLRDHGGFHQGVCGQILGT
jgi:hypothetical protein